MKIWRKKTIRLGVAPHALNSRAPELFKLKKSLCFSKLNTLDMHDRRQVFICTFCIRQHRAHYIILEFKRTKTL